MIITTLLLPLGYIPFTDIAGSDGKENRSSNALCERGLKSREDRLILRKPLTIRRMSRGRARQSSINKTLQGVTGKKGNNLCALVEIVVWCQFDRQQVQKVHRRRRWG
jgi:hypothetical protein